MVFLALIIVILLFLPGYCHSLKKSWNRPGDLSQSSQSKHYSSQVGESYDRAAVRSILLTHRRYWVVFLFLLWQQWVTSPPILQLLSPLAKLDLWSATPLESVAMVTQEMVKIYTDIKWKLLLTIREAKYTFTRKTT